MNKVKRLLKIKKKLIRRTAAINQRRIKSIRYYRKQLTTSIMLHLGRAILI